MGVRSVRRAAFLTIPPDVAVLGGEQPHLAPEFTSHLESCGALRNAVARSDLADTVEGFGKAMDMGDGYPLVAPKQGPTTRGLRAARSLKSCIRSCLALFA